MASATVAGKFINIDKRTFENTILKYKTPKAKLSRLSINITDADGTLFDFGGSGSTSKATQCQFIFKIITIESNRSQINQRNVF
jgi:hypothetical protein